MLRTARVGTSLLSFLLGACTEPHFDSDEAGAARAADEDAAPARSAATDDEADAAPDASILSAPTSDAGSICDRSPCTNTAADAPIDASQPNPHDTQAIVAASDAGVIDAAEGGLDAVRASWVGRYATRSFVFAFESGVRTSGSYLTLAQIKPTPEGGLVLEEELCRFESSFTTFGITAHLLIDYPAGTRFSAAPMTFDSERFSSALATAQVGYGAPPADCVPGMTSSSSPVKPWLTGNVCDCPRASNVPPTSARDCRVTDSDADMEPGNTFHVAFGSSKGVFNVTQEQQLRLLGGYRAGGRLYAQRQAADVTRVLSCIVDGKASRIEDCPLGTVGPCSPMFHKVELVAIDANHGCAEIREREQGWFLSPQPEFPAGCAVAP